MLTNLALRLSELSVGWDYATGDSPRHVGNQLFWNPLMELGLHDDTAWLLTCACVAGGVLLWTVRSIYRDLQGID